MVKKAHIASNFSFFSVPITLVGNKTDLHLERVIPFEEGKKLADSWKVPFLEASARENEVDRYDFEVIWQFPYLHVLVSLFFNLISYCFQTCRVRHAYSRL